MKKVFITFSLLVLTFLISGCGCSKKNLKTVTCKMEKSDSNYKIDSTINIEYDANTNTTMKIVEKTNVELDDETNLNATKNINDVNYSVYANMKYANYTSEIVDNRLKIDFDIDLSKVNIEDFIEADVSNQEIVLDGRVDSSLTVNYYIDNGYSCD